MKWLFAIALIFVSAPAVAAHLTDEDVAQLIIREWRSANKTEADPCACNYDKAGDGSWCGDRSKSGGICRCSDVTPEMIKQRRARGPNMEE